MDHTDIRPYEAADEGRVRELSVRLTEGVAPWRSPDKVAATISTWIDTALSASSDDHIVLVACSVDLGVIGFIVVEAQNHYIDGRDGYIGELVVDRDAEGGGVGRALVAHATDWARERGCERLTLQTGAENTRAREFYGRLGFVDEDVSLARPIERDPSEWK